MPIIQHAAPKRQTTTYKLQEQGPTNPPKTLDTATDRDSGLAKFDKQLREHPVRYRSWTAYRLVLVEDGDR